MLRVGVVGLGVIAQYYLSALDAHPDVEVTVVCDRDPAKASLAPARATFVDDVRHVATASDVDAVVVTLPNDLHHPVCRQLLLSGRHVCCEKPLAVRPEEAADLEAVAVGAGRTLFTAFHRRYNRHAVALARRLRERPPPRHAELIYRELIEEHCGSDAWYLDPARCGGGCVIDNGSNVFDLALWLFGPVSLVRARIGYTSTGVDVRARIDLATRAGGTVGIDLDWGYPGEDKAIRAEWDDGSVDGVDLLTGFAGFKSSLHHEYGGVVADFVDTVRRGRARPDNGAAVADLVAATYRTGRVPA